MEKLLVKNESGIFVPQTTEVAKGATEKKTKQKYKILCDICRIQINVPKRDIPYIIKASCSSCIRNKRMPKADG
jgi:hypothetical protein